MIKKTILILATLISFWYCLRLGYIWTAYGHGGQILGFPFALIMLLVTIAYFFRKQTYRKERAFIFGVTFFLTLASFSATIELIRATKENYFELLYYEPGGFVNQILLAWIVVGAITYITLIVKFKKRWINRE
jgi:hypothetical protein